MLVMSSRAVWFYRMYASQSFVFSSAHAHGPVLGVNVFYYYFLIIWSHVYIHGI